MPKGRRPGPVLKLGGVRPGRLKYYCNAKGCNAKVISYDLDKHYLRKANADVLRRLENSENESDRQLILSKADAHTSYLYTNGFSVTNLPSYKVGHRSVKPPDQQPSTSRPSTSRLPNIANYFGKQAAKQKIARDPPGLIAHSDSEDSDIDDPAEVSQRESLGEDDDSDTPKEVYNTDSPKEVTGSPQEVDLADSLAQDHHVQSRGRDSTRSIFASTSLPDITPQQFLPILNKQFLPNVQLQQEHHLQPRQELHLQVPPQQELQLLQDTQQPPSISNSSSSSDHIPRLALPHQLPLNVPTNVGWAGASHLNQVGWTGVPHQVGCSGVPHLDGLTPSLTDLGGDIDWGEMLNTDTSRVGPEGGNTETEVVSVIRLMQKEKE